MDYIILTAIRKLWPVDEVDRIGKSLGKSRGPKESERDWRDRVALHVQAEDTARALGEIPSHTAGILRKADKAAKKIKSIPVDAKGRELGRKSIPRDSNGETPTDRALSTYIDGKTQDEAVEAMKAHPAFPPTHEGGYRAFKFLQDEWKKFRTMKTYQKMIRTSEAVRDEELMLKQKAERIYVIPVSKSTQTIYERNPKDLPGAPDFVFRKSRVVLFVHDCFLHSHGCEKDLDIGKAYQKYMRRKRAINKAHDAQAIRRLRTGGYMVWILWRCKMGNWAEWEFFEAYVAGRRNLPPKRKKRTQKEIKEEG